MTSHDQQLSTQLEIAQHFLDHYATLRPQTQTMLRDVARYWRQVKARCEYLLELESHHDAANN